MAAITSHANALYCASLLLAGTVGSPSIIAFLIRSSGLRGIVTLSCLAFLLLVDLPVDPRFGYGMLTACCEVLGSTLFSP